MDYILQVTKPGNYKAKKVQPKNRLCTCGTRLSIYNSDTICSQCNHKRMLTDGGVK